jgi:hypothetical protein
MQYLTKITEVVSVLSKFLGSLLGLSIFTELLFGKYLGGFSVVGNVTNVTNPSTGYTTFGRSHQGTQKRN